MQISVLVEEKNFIRFEYFVKFGSGKWENEFVEKSYSSGFMII